MSVQSERAAIAEAVDRASDTRAIITGAGALKETGDLFISQFGRHPALLICDDVTAGIALAAVRENLEGAGVTVIGEMILPGNPTLKPEVETSQTIARELNESLAIPVAIGAGTINDLVKYGAALAKRSYLIVATAASMDGYAASGAALIANGFKQTFVCPAPQAVLADLDIVRNAPTAMTSSGYADLIGKITAGADWILAETVGIETIDPAIWAMVQPWVRELLPAAERVRSHDPESLETLVNGLLMSGLAMQASGTSRPASGSEHQFSHYWEMQGLSVDHTPVSHGFKVGIGSLAVSALYESLLNLTEADLERSATDRWPKFSNIESTINSWKDDPRVIERAVIESRAKYPSNDLRIQHVTQLRAQWPELQQRLRAQLLPAAELREILKLAGCPVTAEEIGLSRKRLKGAYAAARQIRRRYTVLDTVTELGRFDRFVDDLFKPSGFWSEKRE
ncbi:MAG: sn-glycerol-1-phosphate dehydrogenase [Thermomicrobiales bacterium]